MTESKDDGVAKGTVNLIDVVEKLELSVAGLVMEVKGLRTHADSGGYFVQIAAEDLLKAVQELKLLVQK
jgi:hypothetical protein